jgi:predicted ATPase
MASAVRARGENAKLLRAAGRTLFHLGGPERLSLALVVNLGHGKPLRYEVETQGPVGTPRVVRERLSASPVGDGQKPFLFLDFRGGKGVVHDQRKLKRPEWTVQPNELALHRALDPTLVTVSKFQSFLTSWRFYSGFNVSASAQLRRPVPTEPDPILDADGSNLSAVLFSLMTEHTEQWSGLEAAGSAA